MSVYVHILAVTPSICKFCTSDFSLISGSLFLCIFGRLSWCYTTLFTRLE